MVVQRGLIHVHCAPPTTRGAVAFRYRTRILKGVSHYSLRKRGCVRACAPFTTQQLHQGPIVYPPKIYVCSIRVMERGAAADALPRLTAGLATRAATPGMFDWLLHCVNARAWETMTFSCAYPFLQDECRLMNLFHINSSS